MGWLDFIFKKKDKAEFVQLYEEYSKEIIPAQRPISQLSFIVLDTETTGLNPEKAEMVSFGAVKITRSKIQVESAKEHYFDTSAKNQEALKVHGILYPQNPTKPEVFAKELLPFLHNHILVGHHIGFDLKVLGKFLAPFGLKKITNPVLDTQYLATRLEKGYHYDVGMGKPGEYTLDSLCERYGIQLDDRHTAAGDAFLTAQLLLKLLKKAEKIGIADYRTLMR
ncbi:DNA polymerase III epsilon subunit [Indibacter alkaliphilus LW1]|uniref:DNA polymerase III epsilon subunit n=2 Tax=Indibacter TaxID=647744 RepID=S2DBQ5_INDAL|nr:DNA polymerase III epsilon subunit [Indibacter alkaliphilus LW1]